ncbi:MAG: LPXTG cell wall anchor domain-containing protein [Mycobacteriales bacterium]
MRRWRSALVAGVLGAGLALVPAGAALAAPKACDAYSNSCTVVKGEMFSRPLPGVEGEFFAKPVTTQVQGETFSRSSLPFTGADIALLVLVGVAATGAGGGLLVASRRRRHQTG